MKSNTEKELIGKFLLTTFSPGAILRPENCETIRAAQERLFRQLKRNTENARNAGRKPVKKPSKATLYQRERRARLKEAK
jgi:hypothetical protein